MSQYRDFPDLLDRIKRGVGGVDPEGTERTLRENPDKAREIIGEFSPGAQRAIFFSRYEALKLGAKAIEPEHLLLGILREKERILHQLLPPMSFDLNALRRRLENGILVTEWPTTEIELSNQIAEILKFASQDALKLGHQFVNSGHLLLGILHLSENSAAAALREIGVSHEGLQLALVTIPEELSL